MTRTLQEIKAELEALHQENQTAIEKYTEDLKAIDPKIEQAKQDIADAQTTVDAEAYDIAKRELWTAENTKEMLKNKLDELTQKPLISKRDYNKLVDEINVLAEKEMDTAHKNKDWNTYYTLFKEQYLDNEKQWGYLGRYVVNGFEIHDPDFVSNIVKTIEQQKKKKKKNASTHVPTII